MSKANINTRLNVHHTAYKAVALFQWERSPATISKLSIQLISPVSIGMDEDLILLSGRN